MTYQKMTRRYIANQYTNALWDVFVKSIGTEIYVYDHDRIIDFLVVLCKLDLA